MSHGRDQGIPDNNRVDMKWADCEDCKRNEFICSICYLRYVSECEQR